MASLFDEYVRARSQDNAANCLVIAEPQLFVVSDCWKQGHTLYTHPPEAPVTRTSFPEISLSLNVMFVAEPFGINV